MRTSLALLLFTGILAAQPNVVVFFADDLGFSDLGCYGGDINTPNLDKLAAGGLRFTQAYDTARCWPSRAAILTGYYPQQVRRDTVPEIKPSGNAGLRPSWSKLLPEMLPNYRSYHSGKWHVDGAAHTSGFHKSYLLDDHNRNFSPQQHSEDGIKLATPKPDGSYYTTTAIAEHAVKCLKDHDANHQGKPFFSYVAFTVPHFPLHAPAADVAKYMDKFNDGWDEHRARRLANLKKQGIVNCALSERTEGVPAWDSLSPAEKKEWASRMAVHAAMIDRMDVEIGRVIDQVKAMNAFENTMIVFCSDNGASHEKLDRGDKHKEGSAPGSYESFRCLEPGWANAANAPFRFSKIFVHEGGISTPFIVHWPKGIAAKGELRTTPIHLIDLPPTIVALAKEQWPVNAKAPPVPGKNIAPLFDKDADLQRDCLWWYHQGNKAIRAGDWKLVSKGEKGDWELYNLATDRCEMVNLIAKEPAKAKELATLWNAKWEQFRKDAASETMPKR